MIRLKILSYLLIPLGLICFFSTPGFSQVIVEAPNINKASTQLIYYYDTVVLADNQGGAAANTVIQVTNTNDTEAITIHVQIFRSFDPDDDGPADPVICDERDFIDLLTPNDTHVYDLTVPNFPKNTGETGLLAGDLTTIDVSSNFGDGTKGFIVITPVVSESDLTAVAFQHLIGTSKDNSLDFRLNARGRDAVDFTTGEELADFTPLDGVTTGLELIQTDTGTFHFSNDFGPAFVDLVFISFQDEYGDPGLLGYTVAPTTTSFNTFIYDFKEDVTSCGSREFSCFLTVGINETFPQNNIELSNGNDVLCSGVTSPLNPALIARVVDPTIAFTDVVEDVEAMGFLKFFFDNSGAGGARDQISQVENGLTSFFNIGVTSNDPCACAQQNGHSTFTNGQEPVPCPEECFDPCSGCFQIIGKMVDEGIPLTNLNVEYCPYECCHIIKEFNQLISCDE